MKSKYIVIAGILLAIGAIVRLISLAVPGAITSNLVIAFYALAIVLIMPTITEAIGIGFVAGIICMLISKSVFPPGNLISEPIGALVAVLVIKGIEGFTSNTKRKDNILGYILTAASAISLIGFVIAIIAVDLLKISLQKSYGISNMNVLAIGIILIVALMIGMYLIPNMLRKFKAGVTAMLATLASGTAFVVIAAFVVVDMPNFLNQAAPSLAKGVPPVDVFILGVLPIVIGCAVINFVLAQVLYVPAKKAMR